MERTLRLSPFECFLESEANQVVIKVTGVLHGTSFTVSALGYEISIPVISTQEDQFGKYQLVEPQKRELGDGWFLNWSCTRTAPTKLRAVNCHFDSSGMSWRHSLSSGVLISIRCY